MRIVKIIVTPLLSTIAFSLKKRKIIEYSIELEME
jgi:hypothetical protein